MQINISSHHIDLTDALRKHVEEKFKRFERYLDNITNVQVILEVKKNRQKAEATIHVSKKEIYADAEDTNMYNSIDQLAAKLDRQLKKYKEKMNDYRGANPAKH